VPKLEALEDGFVRIAGPEYGPDDLSRRPRVQCSRGEGEDVQMLSGVNVPRSTYVLVVVVSRV
jgi:hypothetical protein